MEWYAPSQYYGNNISAYCAFMIPVEIVPLKVMLVSVANELPGHPKNMRDRKLVGTSFSRSDAAVY